MREHSVQRRAGGENMHIRVIGVPMDLGADRRGVDIGASAIRYAGLNDQLRHLNYEVNDVGNIIVPQPESQPIGNTHLKYLEPILKVAEELADTVTSALTAQEFPLILGGDHSIALGSITGVTRVYKDISVLWIDAHADFNTEETTPSGNVHGMILAALAGFGIAILPVLVDGHLNSTRKKLLLLVRVILISVSVNFYAHITSTSLLCPMWINVAFQMLCARLSP